MVPDTVRERLHALSVALAEYSAAIDAHAQDQDDQRAMVATLRAELADLERRHGEQARRMKRLEDAIERHIAHS